MGHDRALPALPGTLPQDRDGLSGTLTRRALVALAGAATVAAAATRWPAARPVAGAAVPAHLDRATYAALADRRFSAAAGALLLDDVRDLAGGGFALRFTGSAGALEQGTHALAHPELGAFDLHLVPVGAPRRRPTYEAVIATGRP